MSNNTKRILPRLPVVVGFAALAFFVFAPDAAQAQSQELFACYVPNSGVVYRVNPPGSPGESPDLKDDCTGKKHVKFSWAKLAVANGKVGIGVPNPTVALDVAGDIHASGKLIIGNTITIDDATNAITSTSGTISFDDENLVTSGTVESTSGGIKFPDGTVQTTASTGGGGAWSLTGNSGTDGGATNFVGTTDNVALEVHVNSNRVLRLEPKATSPNILGGSSVNGVSTTFVSGATIGGGGETGLVNQVTDSWGTIGGGRGNTAGFTGTVAGGVNNSASAFIATIGGGADNTATGLIATVAGGNINTSSGTEAAVGGGFQNVASSARATVAGGSNNTASALGAAVGGGDGNTASEPRSTVGGGRDNTAGGAEATVGGGVDNLASASSSTVGGGRGNIASDIEATVAGGDRNTASGAEATVGGGLLNTASGTSSTVPGGAANTASGALSFAAGANAKAVTSGTFVWSDTEGPDFTSTANNQFLIRAGGGVGIGTNAPQDRLEVSGGNIRVTGGSFIDDGTTLSAPDYVFEKDYPLMSLDELRAYIVQEKHLPNVPSADDIKKDGLNLSEFQMRLLEKIEELTLYILAQQEQIEALKIQVRE